MAFSDYASTTSVRPDRPLVVKCTFDQRLKRITFASSRNCSYDLLRAKVEQCFALSATPFTIRYKDDDGEITDVNTDGDLTEAIHYFNAGDDPPISSGSSVLSGRSASGRRITLRLTVAVDYELSLSDTASIISQDEYTGPNASDLTLSEEPLNGYIHGMELEDDAVTVSSRDTGSISRGGPALQINSRAPMRPLSPVVSEYSPPVSSLANTSLADDNENITTSPTQKGKPTRPLPAIPSEEQTFATLLHEPRPLVAAGAVAEESANAPDTPRDVFERLKRLEGADFGDSFEAQDVKRLSQTERGVQWLRDQNVRAIQSMFGTLPEPSISDDAESVMVSRSPEESIVGDLALEQDQHGKYYYTYTSSSGASQAQEEPYNLLHDNNSTVDSMVNGDEESRHGEPSPHGLAWLADQQHAKASSSSVALRPSPFSDPSPAHIQEHYLIHPSIPPEVLKFVPNDRLPLLPPDQVTHCASCGRTLDSFRYVCTTCGELKPRSPHTPPSPPPKDKGKGKDTFNANGNAFLYPPGHRTAPSSPASSSWSLLSAPSLPPRTSSLQASPGMPILAAPRTLSTSTSQDTLVVPPSHHSAPQGYELCSGCIESAGVFHALEAGTGTSPHSSSPLSSPDENIRAWSQLGRTAPRSKGHLRHAYREKVWGPEGWKDVEQDDIPECSICNSSLRVNRYKCASCPKFDLCRACYSQVHEIHPSHAFLSVPDQDKYGHRESEEEELVASSETNGEPSLKHPGVKCHHCMLDIVGARFHCAVCDSVDICSNCESAGLPGNLTSPDGGHDSSHIMIKIPYPLESTEVETASRRAISLWHGRDRPELQRPRGGRRRSSSQDSAHARTVVGSRINNGVHSRHGSGRRDEDHRLPCRTCGDSIVGTRYQCATCPSSPTSYNLCAKCEVQSYLVHDPRHIFIKLPRVLDRPIQTPFPLLPATLYSTPAGIVSGRRTPLDPRGYIQSLYHRTALCDRCVEHIRGVWLHCAYCGSDLCEECESFGTHDNTHVFLVFKSMVNMDRLGAICNIDNPEQSPPIIPHPVYLSS